MCSNMQVIVSNEIVDTTKYIAREIVKQLSAKYDFNCDEAINFLEINIPEREITKTETLNPEKNNIPLPFSGNINPNRCHGIRFNYGLYTQCTNSPCLFSTEYPVCQTCSKQVEKNSNNKLSQSLAVPSYQKNNNQLALISVIQEENEKAIME